MSEQVCCSSGLKPLNRKEKTIVYIEEAGKYKRAVWYGGLDPTLLYTVFGYEIELFKDGKIRFKDISN